LTRGTYTFSNRLTSLDEDRTYYYRAVAEDEDGDEDYGGIESFRTDEKSSNSYDDEPDVDAWSAVNVTDEEATLRGKVDMNDFKNGVVFFVYGEDEGQVEDVSSDYDTYAEVDEDGDDLQKVRVDIDLDGSDTYAEDIDGLDNDTDIFFTLCVEYEDEDYDEVIECGGVEEFTTDE
jgi:hypothetical protein